VKEITSSKKDQIFDGTNVVTFSEQNKIKTRLKVELALKMQKTIFVFVREY